MAYRLILFLILLFFPLSVFATANNKVGIHLAQPHLNDLVKIKELVNSSGGDWGYVTVVIEEGDRNLQKWQEIFDIFREHHLVPIVRLATHPEGEVWARPKKEDASSWAEFLNSLNWVVKKRYIILFNEPNHGSEWGSEVDAENYAQVATEFAKKLKEKSPDFFVMLAGLDASAPQSPPVYEDEESFINKAFNTDLLGTELASRQTSGPLAPRSSSESEESLRRSLAQTSTFCANLIECFNKGIIDGWSSHSYPNPGFAGSPWGQGRGTVRTYEWELTLLKSLGVTKELPVFITETGWSADKLSRTQITDNYKAVYENIWLQDPRVMAVTPFVFDYQGPPFLGFSWKLPSAEASEERAFYQQYYSVQSMLKVKGEPEQIEKGEINFNLPDKLVAQSNYHFNVKIKNLGQGFWDKDGGYELGVMSYGLGGEKETETFKYFFGDIKRVRPGEEAEIDFYLKTENYTSVKIKFILMKNNQPIVESKDWEFEILPLPSLKLQTMLFPKLLTNGDDFELQIFDDKEGLVFKKKNLTVKNSLGEVKDIQNIAFGKKYRVVILKPYYLPRQAFATFKKNEQAAVLFEKMLPFDLSRDGKLDAQDFLSLFGNIKLFSLFFP